MNRVKPFLFYFFLLCSFQIPAAEREMPAHTILDRTVAEGNIYAFRIETEKLLNDPVHDFFKSMAVYMREGGGFDQHIQTVSSRASSSVEVTKQFFFENAVLSSALSLPLGKVNKENLTATHSALFSDNMPVYFLLKEYDNNMTHELYDGGTMSVWSKLAYLSADVKDNPWRRLPKIRLSETPPVQALVSGDLTAFQKNWRDLLQGPTRDLFALLHSSGENRETFLHYMAEFRPKHLQGIDIEDLTPEQGKELNNSREVIASSLKELIDLFPPAVKDGGNFPVTEQRGVSFRLSGWIDKNTLIMGGFSTVYALIAFYNMDSLIGLVSGLASGFSAAKTVKCYNAFKTSRVESKQKKK